MTFFSQTAFHTISDKFSERIQLFCQPACTYRDIQIKADRLFHCYSLSYLTTCKVSEGIIKNRFEKKCE